MISTVLLLASLPQLITYETKAARLPVILAELEPRIGMKLGSEQSFKNDVLVIRVDEVDSKTLLDKIAQAAVGKWTRSGDRLVLSPDSVRRKKQEDELLARRERDIQRMLDQYKKDLEKAYDGPTLHALKSAIDERRSGYDQQQYAARVGQERAFRPLDRLAMRSLIEIGARRLAEIKPGQRLVFSANPTPRQLKWPKQSELLKSFYAEWNLHQELFGADPRGSTWVYLRNTGLLPTQLSSVDRIWLAVADPLRESRGAKITIVNAAETVAFGNTMDLTIPPQSAATTSPDNLPETKLTLEPLSEALSIALRNLWTFPRPKVEIDPKLIELVSRPTKYEPLAIGSELYLQYAAARNVHLVAWINDNAFGRGVTFKAENVKMFDQFSRPNMNFEESEGWLVMTPASPAEARRSRDDRAAMERLIQSVIADKRITLDAKADYVFQRPVTLPEGLGLRLALMLDQSHPTLNQEANEQVLRLYGSLSPDQRRAIRSGGRIPSAALSPAQRSVWEHVVYGTRPSSISPSFAPADKNVRYDRIYGMAIEPTHEWPNGIPSGASLGLELSTDFELHPQPKDNVHFSGAYDLAHQLFYEQNPELIDGDIRQWLRPDTFVAYDKTSMTFNIVLDKNFAWTGTIDDLKNISGPVKADQLPSHIREAVKKQVEEMNRQRAAGMKYKLTVGGAVRQGQKPPPP
jgi:hypothetical protein